MPCHIGRSWFPSAWPVAKGSQPLRLMLRLRGRRCYPRVVAALTARSNHVVIIIIIIPLGIIIWGDCLQPSPRFEGDIWRRERVCTGQLHCVIDTAGRKARTEQWRRWLRLQKKRKKFGWIKKRIRNRVPRAKRRADGRRSKEKDEREKK